MIEFAGKLGANSFFDCVFWSDFADEDEKLFIGGLQVFFFKTIRNIKTKQNYKVYVKAIAMFHAMIQGFLWNEENGAIQKKHCFAMRRLIEAEIAQKAVKGESSVIPDYVLFLWHNLVVQVKHCEIVWRNMIVDKLNAGFPAYGFKPLVPLFSNEDMTAPDFGVFTKLFPNLETMCVYWSRRFSESVALTPLLVSNLLESVQTHSKIRKIDIVNPKDDIMDFVTDNKKQFEEIGWTLSKKTFQSVEHSNYGKCESNLCIEKM